MVRQTRQFLSMQDLARWLLVTAVNLPKPLWIAVGILGLAGLGAGLFVQPQLTIFAMVAIGIGIPAAIFAWNYPEFILVGVVFLSSGFIHAKRMEIGGGLELRDAAFVGTLGLLMFQGILRNNWKLPMPRVAIPLLLFLIIAFLSLMNALLFENVAINWAFNDMRIIIYYAMFFAVGWAVTKEKQVRVIWLGLFIIADLIALIIYLQQPLGTSRPLLESMVGGRWNLYPYGLGVRVVPAAHALMHFMATISFAFIVYAKKSKWLFWFGVFQFGFLNLSLLLTFTRSQWLATFIAVFLIAVAVAPQYKDEILRWLVKYSVPTALVTICVLGFFGTAVAETLTQVPLIGGVVERASTIFTPSDTLETNSLEWRKFEFQLGMDALRENPWLGVSLGNNYRQVTTIQGEALGWWTNGILDAGYISRFTRYVHSSYLSIAVKMGILGFATFMWFCIALIYEGFLLFRRLPEGINKGIVLAIITGFIGLMQWSIFHTHFMRTESTIAVGILAGIVAAINHLHRSNLIEGAPSNGSENWKTYFNVFRE